MKTPWGIFRKPTHIGIALQTVAYCDFKCAHCLVSASNTESPKYISTAMLRKVERVVKNLRRRNVKVSITLTGGEPLHNLKEFKRVLSIVSKWDLFLLEFTSNGSFLVDKKKTRKVFELLKSHVAKNGGIFSDRYKFYARISDDQYHDQFRPEHLRGGKLRTFLRRLWVDSPELVAGTPKPIGGTGWIYVESRTRGDLTEIVPIGRGKSIGTADFGKDGCCSTMLSYKTNGTFHDMCCCGSDCPFGTVDDDPLVAFFTCQAFLAEVKPWCINCRTKAKAWSKKRLADVQSTLTKLVNETYGK